MTRYCDVIAHEYTHGIIHHSCELIYQGESGALNESFADIFGLMAERWILGPNAVSNWLLGGDAGVTIPTRSFIDPAAEGSHSINNNGVCGGAAGQPDTYEGDRWTDVDALATCDFGGVHGNSGVQNHWFYLLSEGGTGTNDNNDNYTVQGIGMDDAAEIAFWSMQNELIEDSDYDDARSAAVAAAIMLFGNCSNQHGQTENAWYAVGVGDESACVGLSVENHLNENFSVRPNPTENFVKLNWSTKSKFDVVVYDITGRMILKKENVTNNMVFDIQSVPSGTYILEANDNGQTIRKKVIKN